MRLLLPLLFVCACGGSGGSGPDAGPPDASTGPVCGDGVVDSPEACDDGNDAIDDGCVDCALASCGDGFVRTGVETCDGVSATCVQCSDCTGVADPATGHCYSIVATIANRAAGQASCAAAGAHLASLDSAGEWAAIASLWTTPFPGTWLGLRRAVDGMNVWQWETGVPLGTPTWNTGEPNDAGGLEDCVEATGATGVWNDVACTQTRRALCERPQWSLDPVTNHAYRVFYALRTHPEAIADCAAIGGHLATITTAEEQAYVASIAPLAVWIGAFQGATENGWFWTSAEEFDFAAWSDGQPDDFSANEDCAQLLATDRRWNDVACTTRIPFLCEVD